MKFKAYINSKNKHTFIFLMSFNCQKKKNDPCALEIFNLLLKCKFTKTKKPYFLNLIVHTKKQNTYGRCKIPTTLKFGTYF